MRTEDGYIIHKCLNGEPGAFGLLVDKYKAGIYAFAYSKLYNFHDAEDIAQEAFIKAYRKLHTLKRTDSFLAWLYSITANLCKNWIRAKSNRPDREFIEDQDPKTFDEPSISSYRGKQVCESIREALDSLPEMYREVLTLYYLGGLSCREIARFLGVSPNAIEQRLSRARMKLREETLIMMSATFDQVKLQPSFTFRIVELVKRINIQPMTRAPWLPWGLSLATGVILTVMSFMSFIPHLISFNPMASRPAIEAEVLDIGEVPVDVVKVSEVPIIYGGRGGSRTASTLRNALAFLFAPQGGEGKWTKKADIPTERSDLATVVVNGKIYAIGGRRWGEYIRTVEEYDPVADKWVKKGEMPHPRAWACANVVNGKVYVIGGFNQRSLARVDEYDPLTDKWMQKADMPTARWYFSTSVVNGKIYAVGGQPGDRGRLATVEEYDPVADKWTQKADMPTSRNGLSTSAVNGKIYAIGGYGGGDRKVEEYDPVTDKWTQKADLPTARAVLSTSAVNGRIYAIGGFAPWPDGSVAVEEYDPVADKWTKKADLPVPRVGLSTSVVKEKIYAIGGGPSQFIPWSTTVLEYDPGFAGEGEEGQGVEAKGKQATSWGKMKK